MQLFEPFVLGGKLTVQNRIVMPPMVTRLATTEGDVTDGADRPLRALRDAAAPAWS